MKNVKWKNEMRHQYFSFIVKFMIAFCLIKITPAPGSSGVESSVIDYDWRVVRVYPHDPDAFTQGLIFRDGYFYESTGRRGKSSLRKVHPKTGEILQIKVVGDEFFAEGLTALDDRLFQLTLSSETGFIYDLESFERVGEFEFTGEGWGLTNDGKHLIMSDGTSVLRFLDPDTFEEVRRLIVTERGEEIPNLNELEMIRGKIFANVLLRNEIIEIDPDKGEVTGRIDLDKLVRKVEHEATVNVLNGIAYDVLNDRIFITGKLWPNIYEIKIRENF